MTPFSGLSQLNVKDDKAKQIALKLVTAISSNNYEEHLHFAQNFISEATLQRLGGVARYADYLSAESHFHGGFNFNSITIVEAKDNQIRANAYLTSLNTGFVYRAELTIIDDKLSRLRFRAASENTQQIKINSEQDAIKILTKYVDQLGSKDVFSGTVAISKNGKILMSKAVGMASKRFNAPNNINTRFNLGSMNKMFTAVTMLRLIEQGKLSLTDKVSDVLEITSDNAMFNQIEVQHLLSHSSGVGALRCEQGDTSIVQSWKKCLENVAKIEVNFTPGSQYRYSSDGMFIVGLLIEKLTNNNYYNAIENEVFNIANMTATKCLDLQYPVRNAAIGYYYHGIKQQWRNNLFIHNRKGDPAGGCYSTAEDMLKFANALLTNKLLSPELTNLALTAKTQFGAENYGFGFIVREVNGQKVVGHNGSFPGVSSQLDMNLANGYSIVVLSNHSFAAAPVLAKYQQLF
jgi:CubicO group peptidase (beta-lactamase class C family)